MILQIELYYYIILLLPVRITIRHRLAIHIARLNLYTYYKINDIAKSNSYFILNNNIK